MVYNQQHSFAKIKNINDFKDTSLDSLHKGLNEIQKKFTNFKKVIPKTKDKEDLKAKVLDSAGDLFNELYYIYIEKYEEEIDAVNEKDTKKFDYTKLRPSDDYKYESEEEEKQSDKKFVKIKQPEKITEDTMRKFYGSIVTNERDVNEELVKKHFNFPTPSAILFSLNYMDKENINTLVNVIKSGLGDLKKEIKKMSKDEVKNE